MVKKVFVTGAAGFIGFHLARALNERGDHVVGYDNFNDYYDPSLKYARRDELKKAGVEVIEGDLLDKELLKEKAIEHQTTHFAHIAAQPGVRYSILNPDAYLRSNLQGFLNVLEVCRDLKDVKLTYASSSSVYGLNKKIPFSESDRTDHQVSLYGATKKSNELLAYSYHHLYNLSMTGLRFFTVYGPWGRPDMAPYLFTKSVINQETIKVFNHGKLKRDFTYIDDIVKGTVAAIDLEANWEIFNLGNHRPVELEEFIRVIEEAAGKKAHKEYVPMQPGDVLETYADISHAREKLHFHPKTSLEEGMAKFVEWYHHFH